MLLYPWFNRKWKDARVRVLQVPDYVSGHLKLRGKYRRHFTWRQKPRNIWRTDYYIKNSSHEKINRARRGVNSAHTYISFQTTNAAYIYLWHLSMQQITESGGLRVTKTNTRFEIVTFTRIIGSLATSEVVEPYKYI